jgi:hypothetical protein
VDVQARVHHRLARAESERLAAALLHPALRCPVRGSGSCSTRARNLSASCAPAFQLNLNTGPRMERHVSYDPDAEARFWFVLDTAIARERHVPLPGSPDHAAPSAVAAAPAIRACATRSRGIARATAARQCSLLAGDGPGRRRDAGYRRVGAAVWASAQLPDPAPVAKALARRADRATPAPTPSEVARIREPVERLLAVGAHRAGPRLTLRLNTSRGSRARARLAPQVARRFSVHVILALWLVPRACATALAVPRHRRPLPLS